MKKSFEHLLREAAVESLSLEERSRMRSTLTEYARMKPRREKVAEEEQRSILHLFPLFLRQPIGAVVATSFLMVASFGGVASAAEGALPGDFLYPVKVSMLEPARTLLATTPEEKVAVHMALAERRIDEAATLAEQGRLEASTEADLAARFAASAENAQKAVDESADSSTEAEASTLAFNNRLAAYESVLAVVEEKRTKGSSAPLRDAIRSKIAFAEPPQESKKSADTMLFSASLRAAPIRTPDETEKVRERAEKALNVSATTIAKAEGSLDAKTRASVRTEYAFIEKRLTEAKEFMQNEQYDAAYTALEEVLASVARLDVLVHAAATLRINVFQFSSAEETRKGENPSEEAENLIPETEKQLPDIEVPATSTLQIPL